MNAKLINLIDFTGDNFLGLKISSNTLYFGLKHLKEQFDDNLSPWERYAVPKRKCADLALQYLCHKQLFL